MRKNKEFRVIFLLIFSQIININNLFQMQYLKGKELVNMLALWESSSTIMLCIVGLYIILAIMSGKQCIGYYMTRFQIASFYANIIVKAIGIIITVVYIHSNNLNNINFYLLQLVIITIDILLNAYTIKNIIYIKSNKKSIKVVNKINPVKCTKYDVEMLGKAMELSVLVGIVNFSYNFFLPIRSVTIIAVSIFVVNMIILRKYKITLDNLEEYKIFKGKNISIVLVILILSNILNLLIMLVGINLRVKVQALFIWDFVVIQLIYVIIIRKIREVYLGMEEHLKRVYN